MLDIIREVLKSTQQSNEFDDIERPTDKAIVNTENIILKYAPISVKIVAEGGLGLFYQKDNYTMYFEVYNDDTFGYLIIDSNDNIVRNEDIPEYKVLQTIEYFLSGRLDYLSRSNK